MQDAALLAQSDLFDLTVDTLFMYKYFSTKHFWTKLEIKFNFFHQNSTQKPMNAVTSVEMIQDS